MYKSVFYVLPVQEEIIGDLQCGFRPNGSITDHIFWIVRYLREKMEYNEAVHRIQGRL
jgi:hypothetical protein